MLWCILKSNLVLTLDDEVRLIWVSQSSSDPQNDCLFLSIPIGHWPDMDSRKITVFCGKETFYLTYILETYSHARYDITRLSLRCGLKLFFRNATLNNEITIPRN